LLGTHYGLLTKCMLQELMEQKMVKVKNHINNTLHLKNLCTQCGPLTGRMLQDLMKKQMVGKNLHNKIVKQSL
jgi:hypothetical protein